MAHYERQLEALFQQAPDDCLGKVVNARRSLERIKEEAGKHTSGG